MLPLLTPRIQTNNLIKPSCLIEKEILNLSLEDPNENHTPNVMKTKIAELTLQNKQFMTRLSHQSTNVIKMQSSK